MSSCRFWNGSLLHELKAGTLGATETAAPGAAWRLTRTVAGHPVLAGFPTRPGEPLSNARFGAVRAFRRPLPMCHVEVEECYGAERAGELGCQNPEFHELPVGSPTFKIVALLTD